MADFTEILDNTAKKENYKQLGLLRFGKKYYAPRFYADYNEVHYFMAKLIFMLMDPARVYINEKQAYLEAHRESAKTTVGSFLVPSYFIYLRGQSMFVSTEILGWTEEQSEKNKQYITGSTGDGRDVVEIPIDEAFILITSETLRTAEIRVADLKHTIEERNDLAQLFGEKDPRIINEAGGNTDYKRRKSSKVWRVNSFITKDNTVVWALGAGQQTRGINVRGSRPTLILPDDIYSGNNTKTEETREKINSWFFRELINSGSSRKCKVLFIGTPVHPETVLTKIKKSQFWFGVTRPIISSNELKMAIKKCLDINGKFVLPIQEECLKIEKTCSTLSWPSDKNLYFILAKYAQCLEDDQLDYFYTEYMCEHTPPETRKLSPEDFYQTDTLECYIVDNKQFVKFQYEGGLWTGRANLYIGIDPAASGEVNSDDTAIIVAGYARCYPRYPGTDDYSMAMEMPKGKVFPIIAHVEGGKYAIYQYEQMPGIVEQTIALCKKYKLEYISVEANGQQINDVRELRRGIEESGLNINVWDETSQGKKEIRIASILLPVIYKHGPVICCQNECIDKIYHQLRFIGKANHDDYPDSWAIAMKGVEIPESIYPKLQKEEKVARRTPARYDKLSKIFENHIYARKLIKYYS